MYDCDNKNICQLPSHPSQRPHAICRLVCLLRNTIFDKILTYTNDVGYLLCVTNMKTHNSSHVINILVNNKRNTQILEIIVWSDEQLYIHIGICDAHPTWVGWSP